jgi:hypothetical protein
MQGSKLVKLRKNRLLFCGSVFFICHSTLNLPWIPEPSRRFNLLFTVEGSGVQGTLNYKLGKLFAPKFLVSTKKL